MTTTHPETHLKHEAARTCPQKIEGVGLISGQSVQVTVLPASVESATVEPSIHFEYQNTLFEAHPAGVVDTHRAVTLMQNGKTLSLVEHLLAAAALSGHYRFRLLIEGAAELPILDGGAAKWIEFLNQALGPAPISTVEYHLEQAVSYQDADHPDIQLMAIPDTTLKMTYLLNFPHPLVEKRWFQFAEPVEKLAEAVASARTFGLLDRIEDLKTATGPSGISHDNALGLLKTSGKTTSSLKMPDEPMRHKVLDFIGDMMLCGLPIQTLRGHFVLINAGHSSHIPFAQRVKSHLRRTH